MNNNDKIIYWDDILIDHPEIIEEVPYENIICFDADSWSWILSEQPQLLPYFEKYYSWDKMWGTAWARLLCEQPQFSEKLDELNHWEKLNEGEFFSEGEDWAMLLANQPQFENKCDMVNGWEKFTIRDWIRLLYDQPKFIKKVKETKIIEKFSYYDWKDLCDYANYNNESYRPIFEDLAKNYLYGILYLIIKNPSRVEEFKSEISKFAAREWAVAIVENPDLLNCCISHDGIEKIRKNEDIKGWILRQTKTKAVKSYFS